MRMDGERETGKTRAQVRRKGDEEKMEEVTEGTRGEGRAARQGDKEANSQFVRDRMNSVMIGLKRGQVVERYIYLSNFF